MPEPTKASPREPASPVFAPYIVDAQQRYAALVNRAMEVMTNAVRNLWQSEIEFWRLGAEQASYAAVPRGTGKDAAASLSSWLEQWQKNLDATLEHLTATSQLCRQCGWDLYNVCEDGLRAAAKQPKPAREKP